MNLFVDYHKKFLISLEKIKKKQLIEYPVNFVSHSVELPPKEQLADISTNIALLLAKYNKKKPLEIANLLKKEFLVDFREFDKIDMWI